MLYIEYWDSNNDRPANRINITIGKPIYTISVTEDGTYAAIGGSEQLFIYNVKTKGSESL